MVQFSQLLSAEALGLELAVTAGLATQARVRMVHSSELPTVDDWLTGGEVLLTIGLFHDLASPRVEGYLQRLQGRGVLGLGIGLGRELPHSAVPAALIAAAERIEFPIFAVPERTSFAAIVATFTALSEQEAQTEVTRALRNQRLMTREAAAGRWRRIPELIAQEFGTPTSLAGLSGRLLAGVPLPGVTADRLLELAGQQSQDSFAPVLIDAPGGYAEAIPLGVDERGGWLVVHPHPAAADRRIFRLVTSTASSLLSLRLPTLLAQRSSRAAAGAECLGWLLAQPRSTAEAHARWRSAMERAPAGPVMLSRLSLGTRAPAASRLAVIVQDAVPDALVRVEGSHLLCAHPAAESAELQRVARTLGCTCAQAQPVQAGDIARTVPQIYPETAEAELTSLLARVPGTELAGWAEAIIGPLRAQPELLTTVRSWTEAGGSAEQVAADLGIHRHTVRARVRRASALLGRDLSLSRHRIVIAVALESDRVLRSDSEPSE